MLSNLYQIFKMIGEEVDSEKRIEECMQYL